MQTTLAQMRRLSQRYLLDSFELLTAARSLDGYGRETITYAASQTVKAQLSAVTGSERRLLEAITDGGVENLETAKLSLPWGTSLTSDHYVRKMGSEKVWEVATVITDETMGAYVVALLTRKAVTDGE